MNIGTLQIEIATNVARIQKDMADVKASVGTAMKDVEQYVGYAKTALVGLGAVTSVGAFTGLISSAIEGKARLYALSLQTGITVESLSALGKVAKYSNTSLDDIAGASNKLSKALFTQNEDSKGAASALKALGLNFTDFQGLGADEQMLKVAKAMDGFQDGTGKSATAMMLFGKTGATLLPFMKELAEKTELYGKQTTESALQAKKYEDNLITLKAAGEEWKRNLVTDMLPSLVAFTNGLIDAKKAHGGWIAALMAGNADTSGGIGDALKKNADSLAAAKKSVDDVMTNAGKPKRGLLSAFDISDAAAFANANSELEKQMGRRAALLLQQTREALASGEGIHDKFDRPKGVLAPKAAGNTGVLKDVADGYDALIKRIKEKAELDTMELQLGRKLNDDEKFRIGVYSEVEKNFEKLSIAKMLAIDEATEYAVALAKERKAQEDNLAVRTQMRTDLQRALEGQAANTKATRDAADAMKITLDQYGKTTEELQAMSSARDRDTAATLRQSAAYADTERDGGALSDEYRQQADALEQLAARKDLLAAKEANDRNDPLSGAQRAVKDYLADVKRAGDATYGVVSGAIKGLEDLTVNALTGGGAKNAARAWVNGLLNEVLRLKVVRPFLDQMFGGVGSGGGGGDFFSSLLGSVAGFFSGGMGTNSTGTSLPTSGGRADGGPVMAGRNYLVGERGPEILRMGSQGGTVIPNGGASRTVQVQIINNGAPVKAQQSQKETSEGTMVTLVIDAISADINGGGKAHDAIQRRFGLNPGGTTPRY